MHMYTHKHACMHTLTHKHKYTSKSLDSESHTHTFTNTNVSLTHVQSMKKEIINEITWYSEQRNLVYEHRHKQKLYKESNHLTWLQIHTYTSCGNILHCPTYASNNKIMMKLCEKYFLNVWGVWINLLWNM